MAKFPTPAEVNAAVLQRLDHVREALASGKAIVKDCSVDLGMGPTAPQESLTVHIEYLIGQPPSLPQTILAALPRDVVLRLRTLLATVAIGDGKERVCRLCAAPRAIHPEVWSTHQFEEAPDPKAEEARDLLRDLAVPIAAALDDVPGRTG